MEYVDLPALEACIDSSDMCTCPTSAFTILADIADALKHVHALGFVHNNIKPGNTFYHPNRGAILIDFGLGGIAAQISGVHNEDLKGSPGRHFCFGRYNALGVA